MLSSAARAAITTRAWVQVTACTILTDRSEIGYLSGKQAVKPAGLAPISKLPGKRQGKEHIQGGRRGGFRCLSRNLWREFQQGGGQLIKDRDALLSFYILPVKHWRWIRTSNPIESMFAIVRHRTGKIKSCLSRKTGLAMAVCRMMSAQAKWRKLDGANRLPERVQGIAFKDGVKKRQNAA